MEESNYTKVPNFILDDPTLRPSEFRVLLHIVRETAGWQKKSAGISLGRFEKATGLAKNTILNSIKSLKKKGIISVSIQRRKDGGDSYSRFSIKGGSKTEPGGSQKLNRGPHQKLNPTKEINIKEERENIFDDDGDDAVLPPDADIHTYMPENEQLRWMSKYAEKVSLAARNPQAYKRKIMKQLEREEPSTMKALESFVLDEVEADFLGRLPIQLDDERIESVYTYRQSKGFDPAWKILVESRDGDGRLIRSYPAPHLLELEIEEGRLLAQRIIYEEEL